MTHTYSTDSGERQYITFVIAAAAIGATFIVSHFLDRHQIAFPWWASPPIDTMAFYGLFYGVFDRLIWKWPFIHRVRITRIPDLSGTWYGEVCPAETNGVSGGLGVKRDITVRIKQTWTRLRIRGETPLSKSHSISGHLITADESSLSYEYLNEPTALAPSTMHAHRGTARLSIDGRGKTLEGEYYSGRDRQSIGTIRLTRRGNER